MLLEGEDQIVEHSAENGIAPARRGIAENSGGTTAEEQHDHGWDEREPAGGGEDTHADQESHHRGQETDHDGRGRFREDRGNVQRRTGTGQEFLGDTAEGRNYLGQEHPDPVEKDGDSYRFLFIIELRY